MTNGKTIAVDPSGIPLELLDRKQWVAWRIETPEGRKPTKVPYTPASQSRAESDNPDTWGNFSLALTRYQQGYDGVGYVFSEADAYFGIDLDACRNPETGELTPWAREIVDTFATYTEISPSGYGVKLTAKGTLPIADRRANKTGRSKQGKKLAEVIGKDAPTFGSKEPEIALYDRGRFWCYTGLRHPGTPDSIEHRQSEVDALWSKLWPPRAERHKANGSTRGNAAPMPDRCAAALQAMLRIDREDGNDGSLRLLMACCRAVEYGLNDDETLRTIRAYAGVKPFPVVWSDENILRRLRDAEHKVEKTKGDECNLTDVGNGRRLARMHGDDLRYVHQWSKWLVWAGNRWMDDNTGEVYRRAKSVARALYDEAATHPDEKQRERLARWAIQCEKAERINAMIAMARSEPGIALLPSQLDRDVCLFNCADGTIDLRTGTLQPHRRDDYLTKLSPVTYGGDESGGESPLWETTIDTIFGSRTELIAYVQRLLGYCLTGDVREQIAPIWWGGGANGKSTIFTAVLEVMGDYAIHGARGLLLQKQSESHPTELFDLFGRRLVVCSETDDSQRLNEALIKDMTGGERIRARRMREDFTEFDATHKVILATNHKPQVAGTDHAIWRRIRLIPFEVKFWDPSLPENASRQPDEHKQDKQLTDKLRAEYSGVLRWLVAGCLDWQRHGLQTPACVMEATKEYQSDEDTLGSFIKRCCTLDANARVSASAFVEAYKEFTGNKYMTHRRMNKLMTERGFLSDRFLGGQDRGKFGYFGIELSEQPVGETCY